MKSQTPILRKGGMSSISQTPGALWLREHSMEVPMMSLVKFMPVPALCSFFLTQFISVKACPRQPTPRGVQSRSQYTGFMEHTFQVGRHGPWAQEQSYSLSSLVNTSPALAGVGRGPRWQEYSQLKETQALLSKSLKPGTGAFELCSMSVAGKISIS